MYIDVCDMLHSKEVTANRNDRIWRMSFMSRWEERYEHVLEDGANLFLKDELGITYGVQ